MMCEDLWLVVVKVLLLLNSIIIITARNKIVLQLQSNNLRCQVCSVVVLLLGCCICLYFVCSMLLSMPKAPLHWMDGALGMDKG